VEFQIKSPWPSTNPTSIETKKKFRASRPNMLLRCGGMCRTFVVFEQNGICRLLGSKKTNLTFQICVFLFLNMDKHKPIIQVFDKL